MVKVFLVQVISTYEQKKRMHTYVTVKIFFFFPENYFIFREDKLHEAVHAYYIYNQAICFNDSSGCAVIVGVICM